MKKHSLLIGSLLLSTMVYGAGFQLNLQGMRQLAMGGSGTAIPWDASTVFYNPAGMTAMTDYQVYGSVNALMPKFRYVEAPTGTEIVDAEENIYTPFSAYVCGPLGYKTPWRIGLGVYTPFGTGINWGDNWTGRYVVQNVHLQTIFFQPTISYEINDIISVGGGFIFATGNVELNRALPVMDMDGNEGQAQLTGSGNGVGFNLGVHFNPTEDLQFGFTYRSQVNMNVNRGYANFSNIPSSLSSSFVNTAFSSKLPLPQVASIGIGWTATEDLTLQLDANYTGWGAYDSLVFDYENNTPGLQDTRLPRNYKNTVSLRGGLHYRFSDIVAGMLGGAYDPTPVVNGYLNPDLPDANRYLATAGLSIHFLQRITAIAALEYIFVEDRHGYSEDAGFTGRYQSKVINPGIAITYDF